MLRFVAVPSNDGTIRKSKNSQITKRYSNFPAALFTILSFKCKSMFFSIMLSLYSPHTVLQRFQPQRREEERRDSENVSALSAGAYTTT
jgi:hypothetical protein